MLQIIYDNISDQVDLNKFNGVFLSCFGNDNNLTWSQGYIETNENIRNNIKNLYDGYISKLGALSHVVVDIVDNIIQIKDTASIKTVDISKQGIAIISSDDVSHYGVMLPDVAEVPDIYSVINYIKIKNNLTGNVSMYSFTTQRFIIKLS